MKEYWMIQKRVNPENSCGGHVWDALTEEGLFSDDEKLETRLQQLKNENMNGILEGLRKEITEFSEALIKTIRSARKEGYVYKSFSKEELPLTFKKVTRNFDPEKSTVFVMCAEFVGSINVLDSIRELLPDYFTPMTSTGIGLETTVAKLDSLLELSSVVDQAVSREMSGITAFVEKQYRTVKMVVNE